MSYIFDLEEVVRGVFFDWERELVLGIVWGRLFLVEGIVSVNVLR